MSPHAMIKLWNGVAMFAVFLNLGYFENDVAGEMYSLWIFGLFLNCTTATKAFLLKWWFWGLFLSCTTAAKAFLLKIYISL
jgi:hypothetical protein